MKSHSSHAIAFVILFINNIAYSQTHELANNNPNNQFNAGEQINLRVAKENCPVFAVAFSPDNLTVACGGVGQQITNWDLNTRKMIKSLSTDKISTLAISFSPSGKQIISLSSGGRCEIWDVAGKGVLPEYTIASSSRVFQQLTISNQKKRIAFETDCKVSIQDLTENKYKEILTLPFKDGVSALAFSENGDVLISAMLNTVQKWEITDSKAKEVRHFQHNDGVVKAVESSKTGDIIAASEGNKIHIYEADKPRITFDSHKETIVGIKCVGSNFWPLISVDDSGLLLMFNKEKEKLLEMKLGVEVESFAISPNRKYIATANSNGTINIVALPALK